MPKTTKTDVLFRRYRNDGPVIAVLPSIPGTDSWWVDCASYTADGQFAPCRVDICETTRAAKESEYIKLAAMLADKGYTLNPIGVFRYRHLIERRKKVKHVQS